VKRREFSTLVSSTAACWPLVAFARQSERVGRIGVRTVGGSDADDSDLPARTGMTALTALGRVGCSSSSGPDVTGLQIFILARLPSRNVRF
jgi:hypothetical protein